MKMSNTLITPLPTDISWVLGGDQRKFLKRRETPRKQRFMLNSLMKIPGNVNIAELQLGTISLQITLKAVRKAFFPGLGDTGIKQVALNLMLLLNKIFIQPRKM